MKTRFVLIGDARSGTTWLADLLRNHPQAACLMEPLASKHEHRLTHHHYYWPDDDVWIRPDEGPQGTYNYIGNYFKEKIWAIPREAVGAKLLSFYFSHYKPVLTNYLRGVPGLKVVRIERNPLRKALSEWHAQELQNWNARDEEPVKERTPGELPWDFLYQKLREYARNAKNMTKVTAGRPVCCVYYHNLVKHHKGTMDAVCEFLEIEPLAEYTTVYKKMTPQSFEELVLNWKALKAKTPAKWGKYWERDRS